MTTVEATAAASTPTASTTTTMTTTADFSPGFETCSEEYSLYQIEDQEDEEQTLWERIKLVSWTEIITSYFSPLSIYLIFIKGMSCSKRAI